MKTTLLKQRDSIVGKANALLYLLERLCKINIFSPNAAIFSLVFFVYAACLHYLCMW